MSRDLFILKMDQETGPIIYILLTEKDTTPDALIEKTDTKESNKTD